MTSRQYQDAIDALGLTQVAAAKFIGVAQRTSHNYATGGTPIPEPVALLLRTIIRFKLPLEKVK